MFFGESVGMRANSFKHPLLSVDVSVRDSVIPSVILFIVYIYHDVICHV